MVCKYGGLESGEHMLPELAQDPPPSSKMF
jgi:hypothetical protein